MARIDCAKYRSVCEDYGVKSLPTISHITVGTVVKYEGDRSEESILAFAERLQGPDVNKVHDCDSLKDATDRHGLVVLSTVSDVRDELRWHFKSLANEYKANYWFYQFKGTCGEYIGNGEGLYLLKRHLNKAIRFPYPTWSSRETYGLQEGGGSQLRDAITQWLSRESFPVYGQITQKNLAKSLSTGKLLAIAVLEDYKPVSQFTTSSHEFHRKFETLAKTYAQHDEHIIYGWLSDPELVQYITMRLSVSLPNVILVKPDLSYYLLVKFQDEVEDEAEIDGPSSEDDNNVSEKLSANYIRSLLIAAEAGKLRFSGGNSFIHVIVRYILSNISKFKTIYRSNSLIMTLIFGFPSVTFTIIMYTSCLYGRRNRGPNEVHPNEAVEEDYDHDDDHDHELDHEQDLNEPVDEGPKSDSDDHLKQD